LHDPLRTGVALAVLAVCLFVGFTVMRGVLLPEGGRPLPSLAAGATPTPRPTATPRPSPTDDLPTDEPLPSDEPFPPDGTESPLPTDGVTPIPTETPLASPAPTFEEPTDTPEPTITPVPPIATETPSSEPTPGEDGEIVRVFPDLVLDGDTPTGTRLVFEFRSEGAQRVSAGVSGGRLVEVSLFTGDPPGSPLTRCFDLRSSAVRANVSRDLKWTVTLIGSDEPTTTTLTLRFRSSDPTVTTSRTVNLPNRC
jgi:hypothetical protein